MIRLSAGTRRVDVDLQRLISTRLLIQANSGGGKSWTLRRLLEQSFGQVQHLVIDPEGEFASLREKYDYVLAGHGGDVPAEPKSAKLLARRLLELGVSAILDIYELRAHERVLFVRRFLEALVDAPRELWHPVIVVIDEAHVYAPQQGEAESRQAVIDLATRGRKRGFCAVLATQRIAKLHKDAAAELNNKLIGRSSLDVDMKRSGEELGFTTRDDLLSLRTLREGEFYAFGPALTPEVTRFQVGGVETSHPKIGTRQTAVQPPPPEKIRAVLSKLADLPAEAEQEAKDSAALRAENARLARELRAAQSSSGSAGVSSADVQRQIREAVAPLRDEVKAARAETAAAEARAASLVKLCVKAILPDLERVTERLRASLNGHAEAPAATAARAPVAAPERTYSPPVKDFDRDFVGGVLTAPQQRVLNAIARFEPFGITEVSRAAAGALARYRHTSGNFNNIVSQLRTAGLVEFPTGGYLALTDAGRMAAEPVDALASVEQLHEAWFEILSKPQASLLRVLIEAYPEPLSREQLGDATGYSPTSGNFNNLCSQLKTLGATTHPSPGFVRASDLLFPAGVPA